MNNLRTGRKTGSGVCFQFPRSVVRKTLEKSAGMVYNTKKRNGEEDETHFICGQRSARGHRGVYAPERRRRGGAAAADLGRHRAWAYLFRPCRHLRPRRMRNGVRQCRRGFEDPARKTVRADKVRHRAGEDVRFFRKAHHRIGGRLAQKAAHRLRGQPAFAPAGRLVRAGRGRFRVR